MLDDFTLYCFKRHLESTQNWTHGNPISSWFDKNIKKCILYEDGTIWHYVICENKKIIWWE